jgi:hypothetical protein
MKISEICEAKPGMPQKPNMKPMSNLVAKHARKFNKAAVHRDRKNDYSRKTKHKNRDTDSY